MYTHVHVCGTNSGRCKHVRMSVYVVYICMELMHRMSQQSRVMCSLLDVGRRTYVMQG